MDQKTFPLHRKRTRALALVALLFLLLYVNNTSRFSERGTGLPTVVAHRGIAQAYDRAGSSQRGCEVERMVPPVHDYLENTIRSISAAFTQGASVVEFDVQLTADDQWAVFHDRRLDCRTNGAGMVRDHTMAELKALDVGYGYTADGGRTYPFRGLGLDAMPSMTEVFEEFPGGGFLVDLKANTVEEGAALAAAISGFPASTQAKLTIFGREVALEGFRQGLSNVPTFSFGSIRTCLLAYIAYGWTGFVPQSCRGVPIYVPINVAPMLWGWPHRFMKRMEDVGSPIVIVGRFGSGPIAPGLDTVEDLQRLPADYDGGIWTNNVELVTGAISP